MSILDPAAATPGALRHRVVIEERVPVPDGAGGGDPGWTARATVWANVEPERIAADLPSEGFRQTARVRITLRHRTDTTLANRIIHDGRTFDIRAVVDPDGRKTWLVCECEERS